MGASKEMTLDEWMKRLPKHHCANNELAALRAKLAEAEKRVEIADDAIASADERINQPCADAIDKLWKEILLRRRPNYGDWDYAGQAYRHIKAEFQEVETALRLSRPTARR